MDNLDLDEIIRKNPHLDRESLEALRKYFQEITPSVKTRYRLAPIGTHRATVGVPAPVHRTARRTKSYPGC